MQTEFLTQWRSAQASRKSRYAAKVLPNLRATVNAAAGGLKLTGNFRRVSELSLPKQRSSEAFTESQT